MGLKVIVSNLQEMENLILVLMACVWFNFPQSHLTICQLEMTFLVKISSFLSPVNYLCICYKISCPFLDFLLCSIDLFYLFINKHHFDCSVFAICL